MSTRLSVDVPGNQATETTLKAVLAALGGGTGSDTPAKEDTLQDVLNAIKAQIDLETNVFTDDSGTYYILRTQVNEGTGAVTTTWVNLAGAVVTPGAGLRPVGNETNTNVTQETFTASVDGPGYVTNDIIIRATILNSSVSPVQVSQVWLNATQNTVITAPAYANISSPLSTLLTSILTGLTANNTQMTDGTQVVKVQPGTAPIPVTEAVQTSLFSRSSTATTTSAQFCAANSNRRALTVKVPSDAAGSVWIRFGANATTDTASYEIVPGEVYEVYGARLSQLAVNCISLSSIPFFASEAS